MPSSPELQKTQTTHTQKRLYREIRKKKSYISYRDLKEQRQTNNDVKGAWSLCISHHDPPPSTPCEQHRLASQFPGSTEPAGGSGLTSQRLTRGMVPKGASGGRYLPRDLPRDEATTATRRLDERRRRNLGERETWQNGKGGSPFSR